MTISAPTIEQVQISKMFTDQVVQRALDEKRASKEVDGKVFLRAAVGVPKVSARDDGTLHVLDGQHRKEMLMLAGYGDDTIPCEVFTGLTLAEEALLFRLSNNTKAVGPLDKFLVRVQEGERNAMVLSGILGRYDWKVRAGSSRGSFAAVRALEGVLTGKLIGEGPTSAATDMVVQILTEAWDRDPHAVRGEIISGLGGLVLRHFEAIDPVAMIRVLHDYPGGAKEFHLAAKGYQTIRKGRLADSVAELMVDRYNTIKRGKNRLPDWRSRAPRGATNVV